MSHRKIVVSLSPGSSCQQWKELCAGETAVALVERKRYLHCHMAVIRERGIFFSVKTFQPKLTEFCFILTMAWCSTTICNNSRGAAANSTRVLPVSLKSDSYLLSVLWCPSAKQIHDLLTATHSAASENDNIFHCSSGLGLCLVV